MQSFSVFQSGEGFGVVHIENPAGADKHYQFATIQQALDLVSSKLAPKVEPAPVPVVEPAPVVEVEPAPVPGV